MDEPQTQDPRRERDAHIKRIFETSLDAVISIDADGFVTYWNKPAEAMFGWTSDEVIGEDLADLIMPERFREAHRRGIKRFLGTGRGPILGRRIETTGLRRDGREFPVELSVVALTSGGVHTFNAFVADITERQHADQVLRTSEEHKTSLLRLSRRLEQAESFAEVLDAALAEVTAVMGYRTLWAYLLSPDAATASLLSVRGQLATLTEREMPIVQVKGDSFIEEAFAAQGVVITEDASVDPRTNKALVSLLDMRTLVAAPMTLADRRIGALGTGSTGAEGVRVPNAMQRDYFLALASHVAVACARVRLLSERARAVDEARALNAELNVRVAERTRQLEQANRELEAFSYSVSHDLRAPLRRIDGFSKILLDDFAADLEPVASEYLRSIRRSAARMGHMIDDLLLLGRVDRQQLAQHEVDLTALVREVIDDLRRETPDRTIQWNVGQLPVVACDPGLVRLLFVNLLANAVKFTKHCAEPVVTVEVQRDGERTIGDGRSPVIVVSDNGAGFDQRDAGRLFGVFQRLHREDEFEGTGIGLATVQRIVHKHGGEIRAFGEVGKGATFCFTLGTPAARPDSAAAPPS